MALSYSEAKKIAIQDYLSNLGFEPYKIRGIDYWYRSPFRNERNASFKINTKLNVWYDHGSDEGGNILDLGVKLHQCTVAEFLERLSNGDLPVNQVSFHQPVIPESKVEILSAQSLKRADLIEYINSRGLKKELADKYCKEIDFRIGSKSYNAIGFQNNSGGYELRNRWFKGSSSPKDVTLINNDSPKLCVSEGFFDFLSVLQINKEGFNSIVDHSDFLILNSLSFIKRAIPILQSHQEVVLFLDNDLAAKKAKENLRANGISFQDASSLYSPYKDVNKFLVEKLTKGSTLSRSRGMKM